MDPMCLRRTSYDQELSCGPGVQYIQFSNSVYVVLTCSIIKDGMIRLTDCQYTPYHYNFFVPNIGKIEIFFCKINSFELRK